jgi:hypothetical protein
MMSYGGQPQMMAGGQMQPGPAGWSSAEWGSMQAQQQAAMRAPGYPPMPQQQPKTMNAPYMAQTPQQMGSSPVAMFQNNNSSTQPNAGVYQGAPPATYSSSAMDPKYQQMQSNAQYSTYPPQNMPYSQQQPPMGRQPSTTNVITSQAPGQQQKQFSQTSQVRVWIFRWQKSKNNYPF